VSDGDVVASDAEIGFLFTSPSMIIEEKIDGANCGMLWDGKNAVIRNRDHILNKGYLKDTPAKAQFRPAWTWFYDHVRQFERLNHRFHHPVGVYGEWLLALHGIEYDALPSYFVAFDIFDPDRGGFVEPLTTRRVLSEAGFNLVPLLHTGPIHTWEQLEAFCNEKSPWSPGEREGIYVKDGEGGILTRRYKMVRSGFVQGSRWSHNCIVKQRLAR
jgi:atypical dual specificity phosphatase